MSLKVYKELEQRSDEWFAARAGIVTASAIGRLITEGRPDPLTFECVECSAPASEPCIGVRGKPIKTMHPARHAASEAAPKVLTVADNETSRGLILTLAAERITGHVEETPMTSAMIRGVEHEPFARDAYEENYGAVEQVGFLRRDFDGYSIGASPDGLCDETGGIEIKCPSPKAHISAVLADEVPRIYMPQLQCFLLVSGREWVDFVSFVGGMALWGKRVHPDPTWFAAIHAAAKSAEQQITDITSRYRAATKSLPMTERILELEEIVA